MHHRDHGCDDARELASARVDGEATHEEQRMLEAHLSVCDDCRTWSDALAAANARLRIAPVDESLAADGERAVEAILAAITVERATVRPSVVPMARLALLLVALAELVGALPGLIGTSSPLGHASREHAAFEIALAMGFAWAAHRPLAAQGIAVVSTILSALVVVTTAVDLADGAVSLTLERGHLVAVLGTALVWAVTHGGPGATTHDHDRHDRHGDRRRNRDRRDPRRRIAVR